MKGAGGVANQFLLIDIGDGRPKIKVNIKEKDEKSGIVRLVWVGDLLPMGAAMEGGAEAGNNANALPFVKVVAGSLREARDEDLRISFRTATSFGRSSRVEGHRDQAR